MLVMFFRPTSGDSTSGPNVEGNMGPSNPSVALAIMHLAVHELDNLVPRHLAPLTHKLVHTQEQYCSLLRFWKTVHSPGHVPGRPFTCVHVTRIVGKDQHIRTAFMHGQEHHIQRRYRYR